MPAIKVLSTSNDSAFRASLRNVLEADTAVALSDRPWDGSDRLYLWLQEARPDVLLLDTSPAPGGTILEHFYASFRAVRILMIVSNCGHVELAEMIMSGARGCIEKGVSPTLWRKAIHTVHEGDLWMNRSALLEILELLVDAAAVARTAPRPSFLPDGRLTEREWEVARLVASGMTNKEVARSMTISDTTVKTHLKHIFNKLNVTRRAQIHRTDGSA